ncbi:fumarate hydratase [Candidatus Omnitrophota bacterium]
MRTIPAKKIVDAVKELSIQANTLLRRDLLTALKVAYTCERNKRAKTVLRMIIKNARIAKNERLAICQDTGLPCVFLEVGQGLRILGDLKSAVNKGVESGYKKGYFRSSVVKDPLARSRSGYSPAVIHTDLVKGNKLKITFLPQGFGCENKARLKMFNPTASSTEIKKFIVEAVRSAGSDACPPYVIGVGIGGTADYACFLAKKALLHKVKGRRYKSTNKVSKLGEELLRQINKLRIGPMGLGGRNTCLGVNIETHPTHIAGLPVAVNISCHALRSASRVI